MRISFVFNHIVPDVNGEIELPGIENMEALETWLTVKRQTSGFININGQLINVNCISRIRIVK